ncbi:hypothetical protein Zmor_018295 [Zophobas morio]|uniref:Uncharacterized protein n=1 Tax=Zophobas morio TaxID=2755281 RepID=A0AA38IE55_9CUCU|nr:hypothetical protein Zmor_018295 [Zophobas morio]
MEDQQRSNLYNKTRKVHPKKRSNILFHFLFCWELPVVIKGWKRDLSEDDMYDPLRETDSKRLGDKLEKLWKDEEMLRKNPSLARAIMTQFGLEFLLYGFIYFPVDLVVILLQPQFLIKLLNYFVPNQKTTSQKQALIYAATIVLFSFLRVLFFHWFILQLSTVGLKARIACSSLIYRKSLSLKRTTFQKVTTGQVINLLSNDVYRLDFVFAYVHFLWISPVEAIAAAFYLDLTLGHAALTGIGFIVVCLLLQTLMSQQIARCRKEVALKTDYRIRLMNDIVVGIQVIKMYTWEKTFIKLVEAARNLEMKKVAKSINLRVVNNSLRLLYTRLSIYICVLIMIFNGVPLTSQYIFGLVNTYEFLKISAIIYVPLAVTLFSEARISVSRIQKFLLTEFEKPSELAKNFRQTESVSSVYLIKNDSGLKNKPLGVFLDNVSLKWSPSFTCNTLTNVNFTANTGEVVGIIGAAGSGKSTLLQTILKEVDAQKGSVEVNGTVSYASQDPWVFPASVKQNILFGEEMDAERYRKVIKVCALERDFSLFPFGDNTLVGDRGVMLSGGQKARINLARAVYRDADIYLLDDPLSAVDAHVAEHIYKECVTGYLREKCVVLVTHQVHHLKNLEKIYLLKLGRIEEVSNTNLELVRIKKEDNKTMSEDVGDLQSNHIPLEIKEHRSSNSMGRKIYKDYCLASGSWCKVFLIVLMLVISQALGNTVEYFVAFLVNLKQDITFHTELKDIFTVNNCTYIYSSLILIFIFATYTALRLLTGFCVQAARNLHSAMLINVIHGTMEFFNHHSSGRILNRFSKDLGCLDESIPLNLILSVTMTLMLAGICGTISILNYWMIIPTIIVLVIIVSYGILFQPTTKNIKRTEAITKSSVFTHTMASLQGLTTIRAFNGQKILQHEFDKHMNLYSSAYYMMIALYSTMTFWTDLTCVIYTSLVIFSFFIFESMISEMYVGYIGLAITQSISLVGLFQYGMRTWTELDSQMTSVERVVEYSKLSPEQDTGTNTPSPDWPKTGKIAFRSVSMRYPGGSSPVLKRISFDIRSGEKIGVVGRTGAGKSSLISVLFRLFPFHGHVIIDGIDTKSIPLAILRSKISIIPQDPVLFLGTLRQNVDPFEEYSDSQLWNALEEVELRGMVANWGSGLETIILEGGSNVSVGQRQLLCLVRAILKNVNIIILDEATANVDLKTDEVIQRVIRRRFQDCTVLTIAHRLNTIMDSDKILVMDAGTIAEFGPPQLLLKNPSGQFYNLVKRSGNKEENVEPGKSAVL